MEYGRDFLFLECIIISSVQNKHAMISANVTMDYFILFTAILARLLLLCKCETKPKKKT